MRFLYFIIYFSLPYLSATAQDSLRLHLVDSSSHLPLAGVSISINGQLIALSDSSGTARFPLVTGAKISLSHTGYQSKTLSVKAFPSNEMISIAMIPFELKLDEVIVVSSTRNNQPIENSPLKVEVLGREEMDEENTIKPSGIASILGDVSGIQVQQSSSTSGNSNIRIQGLDGRYTQVLKDGMPLYDGFSAGFGILSIPPLDLKQVELIKGSASTLYGGGAIGGLINIISRRPSSKQDLIFTVNQTTLKETNLNVYAAKRNKKVGYTFFGGYSRLAAVDVNADGFSDIAKSNSVVLHPRMFIYPSSRTTIIAGYTGTIEERKGGDMLVIENKADSIHRYFEFNKTDRHSGELFIEQSFRKSIKLELKAAVSVFNRGISGLEHYFKGRQLNYYSEVSLLIPYGKNSLVAGINILGNRFTKTRGDTISLNDINNNTVGVFIQSSLHLRENTIVEAGVRNDHQNRYGNFLLPALSVFQRFNKHWASRAGIGFGYKIPDALSPQAKDYAIEQLQPIPLTVKAEFSTGFHAEFNYRNTWGEDNEFFINQAFFLTNVNHPVIATEQLNGNVTFANALKKICTKGSDTYIRLHLHDWELYFGYTFTDARRKYLQQNQFVPYTPAHRAAFTLVKEFSEKWRAGLEASYNGKQYRDDGSQTPGYLFMAGLFGRNIGSHISIILNCENILDYRQSRKESLYTGSISNPMFKTLWAPIDGRTINLSIRYKL